MQAVTVGDLERGAEVDIKEQNQEILRMDGIWGVLV